MQATPHDILKKYWGFNAFRPLQEDIISSVLDGRDTLALLPTGGGKSLCFQVPALCREGICLVVSPLIALMKDQVSNLQKRNIPAAAIFSGMSYREIDRIFDNAAYGGYKFLYLSPERLTTDLAIARIQKMNVNLLAVDEAHCISQWGYDFRPPYLQIADIRQHLPQTPVLALTATATHDVVDDIQERLTFRQKNVFQKSFARENLAYVVLREENKLPKLLDIVQKVPGSGVVYARNRRLTQDVAKYLSDHKVSAHFYHAGVASDQRSARQEAWIAGKIRIMVCTNAFGMGIDKPDVRSVVHLDLPDSLEAYFQEAGRGGRDGKKSYAVLLYAPGDRQTLERGFELAFPPLKEIRRVYQALGSYFQVAVGGGQWQSYDFDLVEFCENFKLEPVLAFSCLKILEQEGWLVMTESVSIAPSFMALVTREQMYDFQLRNPRLDGIIKGLLRVSEGIFQQYSPIREEAVAKFLKIPLPNFLAALRQLHAEGILDYRPAKDKPQIVFLRERVDAPNLTIDQTKFNFRKERHRLRIQKAVAYAENPVCRSAQLLQYFGEKAEPCGVCDVCLGRTKSEPSTEDFNRYKLEISELLKKEPLTERQLFERFAANRQPMVLRTLGFLFDEGVVEKQAEKLRWKR